ncbi:unnamed protein product [Gadus morhua 'NCC']
MSTCGRWCTDLPGEDASVTAFPSEASRGFSEASAAAVVTRMSSDYPVMFPTLYARGHGGPLSGMQGCPRQDLP